MVTSGEELLKILMVCPYFPPEIFGGKETWISNTAKELAVAGHDVTIWTSTIKHKQSTATREAGVRVLRSPVIANFRTYWTPIVIPNWWFRETYDIVHLAEPYATGSTCAAIRAKLSGTPIVVSYHNDPLPLRAYNLSAPLKKINDLTITAYGWTLNQMKLRWANRIVVFSQAQLQRSVYLKGKIRNKVKVVPMGVDKTLLGRVPVSGDFVLFVGRIDLRKGLHHLIDAMTGIDSDLVVIGAGGPDQVKYIETLGLQKLGDRFKMLGSVPQQELYRMYSKCAFLVLPSIDPMETFGGVVIEAMAAGKAVVCTSIAGASDLVAGAQAGLVVEPNNATELRAAVRTLLDRPDVALEMGKRGRALASSFAYERTTEKLRAVYDEVLREKES